MKIFCSSLLLALMATGCQTSLAGKIVDQAGNPVTVDNGMVNIQSEKNPAQNYVVNVDQTGAFKADFDLEKGRYLVEPLIPGYKAELRHVDVPDTNFVSMQVTPVEAAKSTVFSPNNDLSYQGGEGAVNLSSPQF
jgi:hypothetical protein